MARFFKIIFGFVAAFGLLLIAAAFLASPDLQNPPKAIAATPLPAFAFRELREGITLASAKERKVVTDCNSYDNQTTCELAPTDPDDPYAFSTIAGVPTLLSWVSFDQQAVFSGFGATTHHNHFAQVSNALTSAFGETCGFDVKQLQNAFGAKFASIEASWCFKGGTLHLAERSTDNSTESLLSFVPNDKPEAAQKFTPAGL